MNLQNIYDQIDTQDTRLNFLIENARKTSSDYEPFQEKQRLAKLYNLKRTKNKQKQVIKDLQKGYY